ncbi:MAG: hypothetical protein AB7S77_03495, partial [Desulfatirhabdiaceae bacterium]
SVHSQLLCSFMPVDYFLIELYSMPKSKFDFLAISKFRATDSGYIKLQDLGQNTIFLSNQTGALPRHCAIHRHDTKWQTQSVLLQP